VSFYNHNNIMIGRSNKSLRVTQLLLRLVWNWKMTLKIMKISTKVLFITW